MTLEDMGLHDDYEDVRIMPANMLPSTGSLKSLNLDSELYSTYASAKNFLADLQVGENKNIPANQLAQVYNTVTSILKEITKMQTELYNAERLKKLEHAMISAIKLAPKDVQNKFFAEYEMILKAQNGL